MKKVLCALLAVCLLGFVGVAATMANQNNTGCGLGTMVMPEADSTLKQVLVMTTNGFGMNTIGVTLGTSNCEKPAAFASNKRLEQFVAANMDNLARDIAAGRGESLATVVELLQVPAAE